MFRTAEATEIQDLYKLGNRGCRLRIEGGPKSRPDSNSPRRVRIRLIEDQHRPRQRLGHCRDRQRQDRQQPNKDSAEYPHTIWTLANELTTRTGAAETASAV